MEITACGNILSVRGVHFFLVMVKLVLVLDVNILCKFLNVGSREDKTGIPSLFGTHSS